MVSYQIGYGGLHNDGVVGYTLYHYNVLSYHHGQFSLVVIMENYGK